MRNWLKLAKLIEKTRNMEELAKIAIEEGAVESMEELEQALEQYETVGIYEIEEDGTIKILNMDEHRRILQLCETYKIC